MMGITAYPINGRSIHTSPFDRFSLMVLSWYALLTLLIYYIFWYMEGLLYFGDLWSV